MGFPKRYDGILKLSDFTGTETWEHKGRPAWAHTDGPSMDSCGLNWAIPIVSSSPVWRMTERTIRTPKAGWSSAL